MSQPIHTPGPLKPGALNPLTDRIRICRVYENPEFTSTNGIGYKFVANCDNEANGRLLAAAYNAFDSSAKELGVNAVELAERMQDGGIAELFEALGYYHSLCGHEYPGAREQAQRIIAKVKGGAS